MSMQVIRGYNISVSGDGSSKSIAIDFHDAIQADVAIHNKTPVSIFSITSAVEPGNVTATLSGTVVTATWATALAAAQTDGLGVTFNFNGT